MKQKRTTLRRFIKNFPTKSFVNGDKFPSLKGLSYEEAYALFREPSRMYKVLSVKEDSIYYACKTENVSRHGTRFFKQIFTIDYLYIDPTTVNVRRKNPKFVHEFLKLAGITWWVGLSENVINYFEKPSIFKSVLVKTIYNEETLYKAISRRVYGIDIGWRLMKEWLERSRGVGLSLVDLFAFTRNPEKGLRRYMKESYQMQNILQDLLKMAVALNQVVDFTWSEQRVRAEHQRQIEIKTSKELSSKTKDPIYKCFETPENISILNTEYDVFLEGANMHHCLYTCYWNSIERHKMIAFHMTSPEECTFSIRKSTVTSDPTFDQIHLKYNGIVQSQTYDYAFRFMEEHKSQLKEMFEQPVPKKISSQKEECVWADLDF